MALTVSLDTILLQSKTYNQFLSFIDGRALTNTSSRFHEVENLTSPLVSFLGVDYIATLKWDPIKRVSTTGDIRDLFKNSPYQPVFSDSSVQLLKNPNAFPLFFSVSHVQSSTDIKTISDFLNHNDLRHSAITDHAISRQVFSSDITLSKINSQLQGYSFTYSSSDDSFIVTTHAYDSNWHAFVDNQEVSLIRTDYTFYWNSSSFWLPYRDLFLSTD